MNDPAADLPKAFVLNYVTGALTLTRVRRVAAIALLILGLLNLAAGFLIGWATFAWVSNEMRFGMTLQNIFHYAQGECIGLAVALAGTLLPALLQLSLIRFVGGGHRFSSRLALASLVPTIFGMLIATALFGGGLIIVLCDRELAVRVLLTCLGAVIVGTLLVLLLKDLAAYLLWIAANPETEKPPVPFLPGRQQPRDTPGEQP